MIDCYKLIFLVLLPMCHHFYSTASRYWSPMGLEKIPWVCVLCFIFKHLIAKNIFADHHRVSRLFEQSALHTYKVRLTWLLNACIKCKRKIKYYKIISGKLTKLHKQNLFFVFFKLTHVGFSCNATATNLIQSVFFLLLLRFYLAK